MKTLPYLLCLANLLPAENTTFASDLALADHTRFQNPPLPHDAPQGLGSYNYIKRSASSGAPLSTGGTSFHTTCSTMKGHGTHLLSVLAGGQFATEVDGEDYLFLDRDPTWFSGVLAYLRGCRNFAPDSLHADFTPDIGRALQLTAFMREARYYQIEGLHHLLNERCLLASGELRPCIAVMHKADDLEGIDFYLYDMGAQVWYCRYYQRERHCRRKVHRRRPSGFATCTQGRFIYVIGAFVHPVTKKRTIDRLDVHTGVWEFVASLDGTSFEKRRIVAAHLKEASVLVVSHQSPPRNMSPILHIVDLTSGAVQELPCAGHAPDHRFYATCLLQGRLILAGGKVHESKEVPWAWEYDVQEQFWRAMPDMNHQRELAAGVQWNGKAAMVGGYDGGQTVDVVEVFDAATGCWSVLPPMQTQREQIEEVMAVVVQGNLVVIAGCTNDTDAWTSIERYDENAGRWEMMGPMPIYLAGDAAGVLVPHSALRGCFQQLT